MQALGGTFWLRRETVPSMGVTGAISYTLGTIRSTGNIRKTSSREMQSIVSVEDTHDRPVSYMFLVQFWATQGVDTAVGKKRYVK